MESNIRNIIFDMGNVLMKFEPKRFIENHGVTDPEEQGLLEKAIFGSGDWIKLDEGIWDEPDMADMACTRLPEHLHAKARQICLHWFEPIMPIEGMEELVKTCRDKGYGIYLLSNASRVQHDYWKNVPGHQYFDGTVVSADLLMIKPDHRIYEHLLDKYGLKAEECLFIDDKVKNVKAAEEVGIHGYLFDGDVPKLKEYMGV